MSLQRFKPLTRAFIEKMEHQATIERAHMNRRSFSWKLRLVGLAIGIAVVIMLAAWMEHLAS